MSKEVFLPGNILLPRDADMEKWSVIACDQFSAEPEYWAEVEKAVGDAPSTLRLMLPEAYLETKDTAAEVGKINGTMARYLEDGIFKTVENSYVYVERRLPDGKLRRGLVGVLDLEAYDYRPGAAAAVYPTEGTIVDRLPPRVKVREGAELELPHILVFIDDAEQSVIEPLAEKTGGLPDLYDFELLSGGGHISGYRVAGEEADAVRQALLRLGTPEVAAKKYGAGVKPIVYAIGDGNHSLATAKLCWENLKKTLPESEWESHPARFSMVELINLHDSSIEFEPIHRAIFDTEPAHFMADMREFWKIRSKGSGEGHPVRFIAGDMAEDFSVTGLTIGEVIGAAQEFCDSYVEKYGGRIDYIHGDETAAEMASRPGCAGVLLPKLEKGELFPSIMASGVFPKKSFSIGHAREKRYYLECRRIK